jgi:hypothetical protein
VYEVVYRIERVYVDIQFTQLKLSYILSFSETAGLYESACKAGCRLFH